MELSFKLDDVDHVSIVKGEDRSIAFRIVEKDTLKPVDLTGAVVNFEMLLASGVLLRRSSAALTFTDADLSLSLDKIVKTDSGLVDGDLLALTNSGGALPGGLSAQNYYVVNATASGFQLSLTKGGAAVDITTAAGGGTHSLAAVGLVVTSPAQLGTGTITLADHVTDLLEARAFQDAELNYTISGNTRIVTMKRALSVSSQVA